MAALLLHLAERAPNAVADGELPVVGLLVHHCLPWLGKYPFARNNTAIALAALLSLLAHRDVRSFRCFVSDAIQFLHGTAVSDAPLGRGG